MEKLCGRTKTPTRVHGVITLSKVKVMKQRQPESLLHNANGRMEREKVTGYRDGPTML